VQVAHVRYRTYKTGAYWRIISEVGKSSIFGVPAPLALQDIALLKVILMEANTGNGGPPQWRVLYEAALLELDLKKLPQRLTEAQSAIMNRIEELNNSSDGSESQALMNALYVLTDLRRMAKIDDAP
jgi:hypothetical protein